MQPPQSGWQGETGCWINTPSPGSVYALTAIASAKTTPGVLISHFSCGSQPCRSFIQFTLRLSVGIENSKDLLEELEQVFDEIKKNPAICVEGETDDYGA